MSAEED